MSFYRTVDFALIILTPWSVTHGGSRPSDHGPCDNSYDNRHFGFVP
jgi:hypothetical protein